MTEEHRMDYYPISFPEAFGPGELKTFEELCVLIS